MDVANPHKSNSPIVLVYCTFDILKLLSHFRKKLKIIITPNQSLTTKYLIITLSTLLHLKAELIISIVQ